MSDRRFQKATRLLCNILQAEIRFGGYRTRRQRRTNTCEADLDQSVAPWIVRYSSSGARLAFALRRVEPNLCERRPSEIGRSTLVICRPSNFNDMEPDMKEIAIDDERL